MNARRRALLEELDEQVTALEVAAEELVRRSSSQPPTPPPPEGGEGDEDIGMPMVFVRPG